MYAHEWITGDTGTNTDFWTDNLLDTILRRDNLNAVYKKVKGNRVEIPKEEKGKVRKPGVPTVVDRLVQQTISQELTPIFEEQFSDNSFGFGPGRSTHDAIRRCRQNADEGYAYVVSMDLQVKCYNKVVTGVADKIYYLYKGAIYYATYV